MIKKKHYGKVEKGKFVPDDVKTFKMAFYVLEGKEAEITLAKRQKSRSGNQNRYYWGVVVSLLSEYIGEYNEDETHEAMKMQFLKVHHEKLPDTCKSTANLTTAEFEDYIEKIRIWAGSFLGFYIPTPNEVEY